METLFAWVYGILAIVLLIAGTTSIWSYMNQLFNWKWSPKSWSDTRDKIARENTVQHKQNKPLIREPGKPRWRLARTQQIAVVRLSYPWGLLFLSGMIYHYFVSFTVTTYAIMAIVFFCTMPLHFMCKVIAACAHNRRVCADGQTPITRLFKHTAGQMISYHYRWMFTAPRTTRAKREKKIYWYFGWRWLRALVNGLCNFVMGVLHFSWLGKLYHFRMILPIAVYGGLSLIWPVYAVYLLFYHAYDACKEANDSTELEVEPWHVTAKSQPEWNTKKNDANDDTPAAKQLTAGTPVQDDSTLDANSALRSQPKPLEP